MATENRFRDTVVGTVEPLEVVLMRGTTEIDLSGGTYTARCKIVDVDTDAVVKTAGTCAVTTLGIVRYQPTATVVGTARNCRVQFSVYQSAVLKWRTPAINWRLVAAI